MGFYYHNTDIRKVGAGTTRVMSLWSQGSESLGVKEIRHKSVSPPDGYDSTYDRAQEVSCHQDCRWEKSV